MLVVTFQLKMDDRIRLDGIIDGPVGDQILEVLMPYLIFVSSCGGNVNISNFSDFSNFSSYHDFTCEKNFSWPLASSFEACTYE